MKAPSTAKPEQSRHQASNNRGVHGHAQQATAVADSRPEREQQQGLLSLMAGSQRLQRKCACGAPSAAGGSCAACEEKATGANPVVLQRKLAIGAADDPLEREADRVADQVMATSAHPAVSSAPPRIQRFMGQMTKDMGTPPASVDRVLSSPGRPLDRAIQQDMGQRFGYDFSEVRVHTDLAAEQSARDVNANAYTVGHNIVFGTGQYLPATNIGKKLLAHELTHVLQQGGEPQVVQRDPAGGPVPAGPAPFFGLHAAPEAMKGIQIAFRVKSVPHADGMRFDQSIAMPPYSIKTYTRNSDDGGLPVIVYYNVVRTEPGLIGPTLWTEYYVGPDSIVTFLSAVKAYAGAASMSYMFGPPAPNRVEGARFVDAVMAGEGREAADAYGNSLYESVTDPGWWVQMLGGVAGMFEAPAVTVTPPPPPGLRLVSSQPARAVNAVVGRSTAVTLPTAGSNALKAVAAEAPRTAPVLRLVPTPAVEVAPLPQPTPLIPPVIASAVTASISARRGKVAAPSTKSKSEDEEDRKTGDACQRRLGLRPGINARWHLQRPSINGQTTVLAAAFRLDKGIAPPAGQDTNHVSRDWTHLIGRPEDDAGHVIGNRFGGQATFNAVDGNIFPQDLSFNRGTMVSYDKVIAQKHAEGCDVCANIGLIYDGEKSLRPSASVYTYFWRSVGAKEFNPPVSALVPNR